MERENKQNTKGVQQQKKTYGNNSYKSNIYESYKNAFELLAKVTKKRYSAEMSPEHGGEIF